MNVTRLYFIAGSLIFASAIAEARKNDNPRVIYRSKLPGNYNGFILPPFGIFLKESERENSALLAHEKIHWKQFQREGLVPFLFNYIQEARTVGYDLNPYEIEARFEESEYCKTHYTECVRSGESLTVFNPNFRK